MVGFYSFIIIILVAVGIMLQAVDLGYYNERSIIAGIFIILSFICVKIFIDNLKIHNK